MVWEVLLYGAVCLWSFGLVDSISPSQENATCEHEHGVNLDLSGTGITRLRKPFISSADVTCLNLADNQITEIEKGTFDKSTNLRYLNLAGNDFQPHPFLTVTEHPTIETLVLDNTLSTTSNGCFRCYRNQGYQINPTISMFLPNLKNLYLRQNSIASISVTSWAEFMPNVTHLYLSQNEMESVDFLKHVPPTLTHIYLDGNKIRRFMSRSLHTLEELIMDHNQIKILCGPENFCDNGMTLKNAVNLKTFSLSHVGLETIEPDALEDLINIIDLDLSHNEIHSIAKHTFDNLTNLNTLKLHNNKFFTIPDTCTLKNLEILTLDQNKLESIEDRFPCSLPKLRILSMSNNQLIHIAPGAFDKLSSLEELDLSGNKLEILSDNWITAQNSLRHVRFNDNRFINIENMNLKYISQLERLNITGNPLQSFSIKSLIKLPGNTMVDLIQAKTCDCDCEEYRRRYGY